ncbi:MAG: FliH/SctL family protein [Planctomycetota bacterium]
MGLVKRDLAAKTHADAVRLDLSDIAREADRIVRRAEERAKRLIEDAEAERTRLIGDATETGHREGYETGHAEGLAAGLAEGREAALGEHGERLGTLAAAWERALVSFEGAREGMLVSARQEFLRLAAGLVERVTLRAIELDPEAVGRVAEEALRVVADPSRAKVRISSQDEPTVREALPGIMTRLHEGGQAEIVVDESLTPGSVVVSTQGGGLVDATIETRVQRILQALTPAIERRSVRTEPMEVTREASVPAGEDDAGDVGELAA